MHFSGNPSIGPGTASLARVVAEICGTFESSAPAGGCRGAGPGAVEHYDPEDSWRLTDRLLVVPRQQARVKADRMTPAYPEGFFDPTIPLQTTRLEGQASLLPAKLCMRQSELKGRERKQDGLHPMVCRQEFLSTRENRAASNMGRAYRWRKSADCLTISTRDSWKGSTDEFVQGRIERQTDVRTG